MKKTIKKQRDLSVEEIIRQIVRFQLRMKKQGAQIGFTMYVQPAEPNKPAVTDKP